MLTGPPETPTATSGRSARPTARRATNRASNAAAAAAAASGEWKSVTIALRQVHLGRLRMAAPVGHLLPQVRSIQRSAEIGEQQVVAPHQLVADRHELAEHLVRRDSVTPT